MFKTIFTQLCNAKNESPAFVMEQLGFSNSMYSKWNENTVPRPSTLIKIADYFGVSVEYLKGDEGKSAEINTALEGIDFALSGEIREMTENEKQDLLDYIRFKKQQKEDRRDDPS